MGLRANSSLKTMEKKPKIEEPKHQYEKVSINRTRHVLALLCESVCVYIRVFCIYT